MANKQPEQAEEAYKEAIAMNSDRIENYQEIASFYRRQQEIEKAETQMLNMVKAMPDSSKALLTLASFYQNTGKKDKQLTCITNNFIQWRRGRPLLYANSDVGVRYKWSKMLEKTSGGQWITCRQGRLTDRVRQLSVKHPKAQDAIVNCKSLEALTLTFDLKGKRRIDKVVLFAAGHIPETELLTSLDGLKFKMKSHTPSYKADKSVKKIIYQVSKEQASFLKINFLGEKKSLPGELIEVEIWEE